MDMRKQKRGLAHIGRRGFCLIVFGFIFLFSGAQYVAKPQPVTSLQAQAQAIQLALFPRPFYGVLFLFAGLLCMLASWFVGLEKRAFAFSVFLWTYWGLCTAVSAVKASQPLVVLGSAVIYFGIASVLLVVSGWHENG